jgi:hypothetical protein
MHRIVERDRAFFHQHHHGHAGDGLAHGVDAEDRVLRHRSPALHVHVSLQADVCDLTTALDQRRCAGQAASIQIALLDEAIQMLQPAACKANGFGASHERFLDGLLRPCDQINDSRCGSRMKM